MCHLGPRWTDPSSGWEKLLLLQSSGCGHGPRWVVITLTATSRGPGQGSGKGEGFLTSKWLIVKVLGIHFCLCKKFNNDNFRPRAARGCTPIPAAAATSPGPVPAQPGGCVSPRPQPQSPFSKRSAPPVLQRGRNLMFEVETNVPCARGAVYLGGAGVWGRERWSPRGGVGGGCAGTPCLLTSRWLPGASSCSSSVGRRQRAEKM